MITPVADLKGRKVVALASFDSFIKTAQSMLAVCAAAGAETDLLIAEIQGRGPSPQQLANAGIDTQPSTTPADQAFSHPLVAGADVVILLLDSRRTTSFLKEAASSAKDLPVFVTAFPGLIFRDQISSLLARADVDLLCLNSDADLEAYRSVGRSLGLRTENAVATGLPILWNTSSRPHQPDGAIVFFEQPNIPATLAQREYLASSLIALARKHPDIPVKIKSRARKGEATLHPNRWALERLIAKRNPPANLSISHEPLDTLLPATRLALTVSSTAALEAMAYGIPTRVIADFGVAESLGNHFFAEAGIYSTLDGLDPDATPLPDDSWLQLVSRHAGGDAAFLTRLAVLLLRPEQRTFGKQPVQAHGTAAWHAFRSGFRPGFANSILGFLRYLGKRS